MANNYTNLTSLFEDIASAIRSKTGSSEPIVADDFPMAINNIKIGLLNGTKWIQSNVTSGTFRTVCNNNGLWVASSENGLYYSTDGMTWTQSNITSGRFDTICNNNGIWVAGSNNSVTGVYYSTDGMNWNQSNIVNGYTVSVHNANGIWVACNTYYSTSGYIIYSTDGITWTKANCEHRCSAQIVCNNNGIWVAGGDNGFCYSTDGINWSRSNITEEHIKSISGANGVWLAILSNGGNSYQKYGLYYSTDGMTWAPSNISDITRNTQFVCNGNGTWVVDTDAGGLYYSTNGMTWTQSQFRSGSFNMVYYDNGIWVASRKGTQYVQDRMWYSTDGNDWIGSTYCGINTIYNNGIWAAGGDKGLYYSVDGINWKVTNITSGSFKKIYNSNGIWVAGSDNGLYYSVE